MKKCIVAACCIMLFSAMCSAAIYVSPSGSDSNSGTLLSPLYSIAKAVTLVNAGDTIWVHGGTYTYVSTVKVTRSGNASARCNLWAVDGESPFLDFSSMADADSNRGFFLTASYWHFKDIRIHGAGDNGMKLEGSHNILERCVFDNNRDSGLQIGLAKDSPDNPGDTAAYNQIINCDSYLNCDLPSGKNADGFSCKLNPGPGNTFTGCRSWCNADDGFDFYQSNNVILVDSCWTWHSGDVNAFINWKWYSSISSWGGNGNGFKLGGNSSYGANHIAKHCIAFNNIYGTSNDKGFDQNDNNKAITLYQCTSFANNYNYALNNDISEGHVVENCIGFSGKTKNYSITSNSTQKNNSWMIAGITADSSDFIFLSEDSASAPRQADGSLPNNGFGRLRPGSDLIDKGMDLGFPYFGIAPDLGAFETNYGVTDVAEFRPGVPQIFELLQNYPNPFNPATKITFSVSATNRTTLRVYDMKGMQVAELFNGEAQPGQVYTKEFHAEHISSGVYFSVLQSGNQRTVLKMIFIK